MQAHSPEYPHDDDNDGDDVAVRFRSADRATFSRNSLFQLGITRPVMSRGFRRAVSTVTLHFYQLAGLAS